MQCPEPRLSTGVSNSKCHPYDFLDKLTSILSRSAQPADTNINTKSSSPGAFSTYYLGFYTQSVDKPARLRFWNECGGPLRSDAEKVTATCSLDTLDSLSGFVFFGRTRFRSFTSSSSSLTPSQCFFAILLLQKVISIWPEEWYAILSDGRFCRRQEWTFIWN